MEQHVVQKLCKRCEAFDLEKYIAEEATVCIADNFGIATIVLGMTWASCALCSLFEEVLSDSQAATLEFKLHYRPNGWRDKTHFTIIGGPMTSQQLTWRLYPTRKYLRQLSNTTFSLARVGTYARR